MTSNREFLAKFIEMYKSYPCLWKTSHPNYHNKIKRNEAHENILELFKTKDANATKEMVVKKINSMRAAYRKEFNKIKSSERSGAESDEVHVPKLWYFGLLSFLKDLEFPKVYKRAASLIDNIPFGYAQDKDEIEDLYETDSQASSYATSRFSTPQESVKRSRSEADQILDKIVQLIEQPTEIPVRKEKYASFGDHVAEKLRDMPPEMVVFCEKLISDVIFYGETRNLNMSSRIVTECVTLNIDKMLPNVSVSSESENVRFNGTDEQAILNAMHIFKSEN